jgi:chromosome segregation ATPase
VGTALKTLTLRLRGSKTELEEMGEDVTDMATTTSQLQAKLLALTGGKVDIMLDANTFKNSTQILREMAAAWEDMTDVQRASALELMGGKRQANTLSALIKNFDTVEEVIEASAGSAGSALRENEVFLDSFEGRMQQLTAATQSLWQDALDTDLIKDAIQLLTKLIESMSFEDSSLINIVHGLVKALSWFVDTFENSNIAYTLIAFFGARWAQKNGLFDAFIDLQKVSKDTVESLTADIKKLDSEIASLTEKANKQSGRAQKNTLQQIDAKKLLKKQKEENLGAMKLTPQEQQEVVETFDVSAMQKKLGGRKGLVKIRTNQLTNKGATPEQIQADPKIQQWNKEIEEGQKALDDYNNKVKETDTSLNQTNATTTKASSTTGVNTGTQQANAGANAENQGARQANAATTDAQTGEIVEQNGALDQNTGKLKKNTGALSGAGVKLKAFGKQMLQTAAYMAIIQGAMQILDGLAEGVKWLWNEIFPEEKTFEELHDEFEEISSDLAEEKSELKGLEGKLEDVESKIKDIEALGTLSFTSQEELNNLQKQSAELERQIEMQKILTKNKQRGTNAAALSAANAYLKQSAETDKTLDEATQASKETGEKWGSVLDGMLMVGGAITMIAAGWTGAGAIVGGAMMAAGMAGAGKAGLGALGEGVGEAEYKKQQTNQQAIDSYGTKRADYQKKLDDAYAKGDADAYAKILEEYEKFETMMADNIGGLLEYISTVDYNTLSDPQKEQYEAYNRMVNQYNLANGGSITNAVDSILDYDRYEKTGYQFEQIQKQLKKGDISSDEAAQQMQALIDASPSLQAEFAALDIKIEDVIASYVDLGEAAQQDISLMSSLDKISAVTSAFDDLGSAIKEFREEGDVSTGTLESLNEKFGKLDEFEELYKVLATGEGDLESAVTNVANAYVGQVGTLSDLTDDELEIMKSRLAALGVLNAEEVLMSRQKGQAQLDDLGLAYSIDLSNYGSAEQAKLAIAQAAGLNIADIADNQVESLAKKYGVDLENYASIEEKKIAIAQARAKAEAQTDKHDLLKAYQSGDIDYAEYQAGLTDIDNSLNFTSMSGKIQSIIDNAYQGFKFDFDGKIGIGSDFDEGTVDEATKEAQEAFQKEMDYWENRIAANQAKYEQLQNEIDLLEKKGQKADASFYEGQIELENERLWLLDQQRTAARARLKAIEDAGGKGSEEWWEVANTLNGIESDIDDVTASLVDLQDAIGEIDTYRFEEFNNRLDNIVNKLGTIRDLIAPDGEEDWFDEEGNWTEEGVAALGTYLNELETYKQGYADTMAELGKYSDQYTGNEEYYAQLGIHSEQEYYDMVEKLTDQQYDYAKSISDTEQSVVDMYESNIDAVEEYTQKLVESYNDYIDGVKEALDAERDLYNFKKNVQKQTKNIADLERRIASLSGSTNASDIAERRRLEADLYGAREELDDTYYEHARDAQSEALDKEAQAYEESMNRFVEGLRTGLDAATADMDSFLASVTVAASMNADVILEKYNETGLLLDPAITNPWVNAKTKVGEYGDQAMALMDAWKKDGYFSDFSTKAGTNLQSPWTSGADAAADFSNSVATEMSKVVANVESNVKKAKDSLASLTDVITTTDVKVDGTTGGNNGGNGNGNGGQKQTSDPNVRTVQEILKNAYSKSVTVNGIWDAATSNAMKDVQKAMGISRTGKYDAATVVAMRKSLQNKAKNSRSNGQESYAAMCDKYRYALPLAFHAKGTLGTTRDEWAITDEPQFGDELVLVPGKDGNLSFMRKGTGVVPADLTANLMEWGQFTPDSMNLGSGVNINMINNAVNKPEFNFTFDALLKAEHIDENTLPEVKRFVQQEINSLVKQMNYAIKGKTRR